MKKKRRYQKPRADYVGTPFDLLKVKLRGERFVVYMCRACARAWKLADPVQSWRVKALLSHVASHQVDGAIDAAIRFSSAGTAIPPSMRSPNPKKQRPKRKSAEQKVAA